MSTPFHMPLGKRKVLSARLIFIEAVEPFGDAFFRTEEDKGPLAFTALRNAYLAHVSQEILSQPSDTALDDFLAKTLASFKTKAEPLLKDYPELFQQIWDALEKKCGQVSCQACIKQCGSGFPEICKDVTPDYNHVLVDSGGLCIKPLREMYELALKVTRILYNCCSPSAGEFPPVVFATLKYEEHSQLHSLPVSFFVRGETQFPTRGKMSRVELGLTPEVFDYPTFTAIPYVFFHECIAHIFYSISPKLGERETVKETDQFYEGWMDYAAFRVAGSVLGGQKLGIHLAPVIETPENLQAVREVEAHVSALMAEISNPEDFIDAAREYHNARFLRPSDHLTPQDRIAGLTVTKQTIRAKLLQIGVNAARKFLKFLDVQFPEYNPLPLFLRISFELNMLRQFDSDRRQGFVSLMNDLPKDGLVKKFRHEEVSNVIRQYIQDAEISELMEACYTLKNNLSQK